MSITITPTQLKRKEREDGTIPVYLRFTENRKSRYRSTGIAVKQSHWDDGNKRVRQSHPSYRELNLNLEILLDSVEKNKRELKEKNSLSQDSLLKGLEGQLKIDATLHQCRVWMEKNAESISTLQVRKFNVLLDNLTSFIQNERPGWGLYDLDSVWIESFQDYLADIQGNQNSTIFKKIQRFKRIVSFLIKDGKLDFNPFLRVERVDKAAQKKELVFLNMEELDAINAIDLKPGSRRWHSRNYFMYSFYNGGISFKDLAMLQWKNVDLQWLKYKRSKTGQEKNIIQLEPMLRILRNYNESTNDDDYIFPILSGPYNNKKEFLAHISSNNSTVNYHLKEFADQINIDKNISFIVSQHSFARYAFKEGMHFAAIHLALGNKKLKTTVNYLKAIDPVLFKYMIEEQEKELIFTLSREMEKLKS